MDVMVGYDSTNPSLIPAYPKLVFPYINGSYAWDAHKEFPNAVSKSIDVMGNRLDADIADVERYDLSLDGGIAWARKKYQNYKETPCLYSSLSSFGYLASGLVGVPHYFFVADPTGIPHLRSDVPGAVACQHTWTANFDISLASTAWITGGTVPPNTMAPCIGGKLMPDNRGYYLFGNDGGVFSYGTAGFHGSAFGKLTNGETIVGFDVTPSGKGYILFGSKYSVFAFGDAPFLGHPNDP